MAYKSSNWLYERRPLRKPKLGPPDLYPQEPRQKEDELTSINVKQGFSISPTIQNEYGSSRNANIPANKFGAFFSAVIAKKQELNTFQDNSKKKPIVNTKDNMWLVTARTKNAIDSWFRDLCSGTKSLTQMIRKVPFFNKKEEIFAILNEFSVPMSKSIWFIKMSSAYSVALSEAGNKSKKRQLPDQNTEWTQVLCKFTKDLYVKLHDHYHGISSNGISQTTTSSSNLLSSNTNSLGGGGGSSSSGFINSLSFDQLLKSWHYTTQLGHALYEEGLLDKHEYLSWILDQLEKIKSMEDTMLKIILPFVMHYIDEFTKSEYLSRRLAYYSSKKLNLLLADHLNNINNHLHNSTTPFTNSSKNSDPLTTAFKELLSCAQHKYVVLTFSSFVQIIAIKCPTALVWHSVGDSNKLSVFNGSPLDFLPCPPHYLPMPKRPNNDEIKKKIKDCEKEIAVRSAAVEQKWSLKTTSNSPGIVMNRLLKVLDCLDRHMFDKVTSDNSIDSLYSKIFNDNLDQNLVFNANGDELQLNGSVVKLLCEWAVTNKRFGQYRAFIVSKLLERRQSELQNDKEMNSVNESNNKENKDKENLKQQQQSQEDDTGLSIPIYQNLLMNFLDTKAPVYEDSSPTNAENKQLFSNLVLLFGELIRCEVFSHDIYMCTLISRGQFINTPTMIHHNFDSFDSNKNSAPSTLPLLSGLVPTSTGNVHTSSTSVFPSLSSNQSLESSLPMFDSMTDMSSNYGHHNDIDADLGKLVQQITEGHQKEEYQNNNFQELDIFQQDSLNSDKEDTSTTNTNILSAGLSSLTSSTAQVTNNMNTTDSKSIAQRHLYYTIHFPLPQDENTNHDSNQRHVLLYGCGKQRDEARHQIKKVLKEVIKLFNRKFSININDGGKIKKTVIKDGFNFETTLAKFQNLSYFDQNVVTYTGAQACLEMFSGVACNSSYHLPLIESIAFLFDLMENAMNIHDLIEFCTQLLKEMFDIEKQLEKRCPGLAANYVPNVALYIIGVLYKYQNCLLVSTEQTVAIFQNCYKLIEEVENPEDCTSAERCIISFLYDLYISHSTFRSKSFENCSALFSKIKLVLYNSHTPINNTDELNPDFMADFIANPKGKVEPTIIKQLCENNSFRYSFVCNVLISIANSKDIDKVNEVAIFCADLTARCNPLSSEWLGILKALCSKSNNELGYLGAVNKINIKDLTIHDSIAVFICVLIARNCFSMQDFIFHCALPELVTSCQSPTVETEHLARFTCHLLYCLFKTNDSSPLGSTIHSMYSTSPGHYGGSTPGGGSNTPQSYSQSSLQHNSHSRKFMIKYPCDRYLLAAARSSIKFETAAILAVLKVVLMLGDKIDEKELANKMDSQQMQKDTTLSDILGTSETDFNDFGYNSFLGGSARKQDPFETLSLNDFAKFVLKTISSENWVHERCLKEPKKLIGKEYLLDSVLSHKQAQQLLFMICHPRNSNAIESNKVAETEAELKAQTLKILTTLDEWKLGVSVLQLELIYAQVTALQGPIDLTGWLDCVARATLEFFQQAYEDHIKRENQKETSSSKSSGSKNSNFKNYVNKSPSSAAVNSSVKDDCSSSANGYNKSKENNRVWLIAPLIDKLPSTVKGRILKMVAMQLDNGNWIAALGLNYSGSYSSKSKDRGFQQAKSNSSQNFIFNLLGYPPFLALLLDCINSQEEHRETLLSALCAQLQCVLNEDVKNKVIIQEGLQLRLSLVGSMFDLIQKSNNAIVEWSLLLLQLMSYDRVEPQLNYLLFTTVLDMLTILIHTTLATDSNESRDETKKQYQNLMKKLKKEMNYQRVDVGTKLLRQLLPMPKQQCEVIACEPMGSLIDTKGNKIVGFDSIDKKQGLQVSVKQIVSPWELIEGYKNPAPLNWTWFGTFKIERKPLRGEENHHLLPWHTHLTSKPTSHFLHQPQLSPADEDAVEAMDVEPESPSEKLVVISNSYDGPITTVLAKNAISINQQAQSQSSNITNNLQSQQPPSSSINHSSVHNVVGSNVSSTSFSAPTTSSNNLIVNALQSPLAHTIPVNSLNTTNSISSVSASPHHSGSLISQSLAQGPITPNPIVSSVNTNLMMNNATINSAPTPVHQSGTSVLSATLQQPTLHSQLQQRPPATATNNTSGATIHHLNPSSGPSMASLAKIPRMSATSANPSLNQMLGMPPKQPINNPPLELSSSVPNHMNPQPQMMQSLNHSINSHSHQMMQNSNQMHNHPQSNMMHQTPMQTMQTNPNLMGNNLAQQTLTAQPNPQQAIEPPIVPPTNTKQPKKQKQPRKQRKNAKNQQANTSTNNQPPNIEQAGTQNSMNIPNQRAMEYNYTNYNPKTANVVAPQPQAPQQQNPQWYQTPQPVPNQMNQQPSQQMVNTSMNSSMNNSMNNSSNSSMNSSINAPMNNSMNNSMNNNMIQAQVMNQQQINQQQPMMNMNTMNRQQGMIQNQMMSQPPPQRTNMLNVQMQNQMVNQQQQQLGNQLQSNQMIGPQSQGKAAIHHMLMNKTNQQQQQQQANPPMNAPVMNNPQAIQQQQPNQQFIYQQQQQRGPINVQQMNQGQQLNSNFAPVNNMATQQIDNSNQQQFIQQPIPAQYIPQQRQSYVPSNNTMQQQQQIQQPNQPMNNFQQMQHMRQQQQQQSIQRQAPNQQQHNLYQQQQYG